MDKKTDRKTWRAYKWMRHVIPRADLAERKRVAFITGNQRSGTNMLMDVLERSADTQVYHETDPRAFDHYVMRERGIIHRLADRSRMPFVVIKALCEAQDIPELLNEFTRAKAIWMVRHYDDVTNSMVVSFPKHRALMLEIARHKSAGKWRTEKMSEQTYQEVKEHVSEDMTDATAAALQWYFRNKLYFELGLNSDSRVHLTFYEDAVLTPLETFDNICQFLDMRLTSHMTKYVHPRSVNRKAAPNIDARVRALCDDLWQRFQEQRNPLGNHGAS